MAARVTVREGRKRLMIIKEGLQPDMVIMKVAGSHFASCEGRGSSV